MMRKVVIIIFSVLATCEMQAAKTVVSQLTLEEKVGQMVQLVTDLFGDTDADGLFHVSKAKADTLFGIYKIGSVLNVPNSCAPTAGQWEEIIADLQRLSMEHIGIPCLFGLDQNHGSTYTQGGTLFPQNINVGATFSRDIARRCAEATAYETRAVSVPWTFCPTIDLGRDARWPRIYENFGEDCYLNAEMGRQQILGFQGGNSPLTSHHSPLIIDQQHIAACLKHYLGYGVPWSGKDRTPAYISPSDLREKHFAPFLACVREGAASVMVNSASVNGMPVHANHELLTVWLKEQTGWDGVLITDWADINNLYTRERVAKDKKDALCIAVNAGIDMIMEPYSVDACQLLKELVGEGRIPMSRIDDAVSRILRMKERLGLYHQPTQQFKDYPKFGGKEFAQLALEGAVESMVLLKNSPLPTSSLGDESLLPLTKEKLRQLHTSSPQGGREVGRILVTGPNANQMRCMNGGWSYTWQGHRADEFAQQYNTIYEALCNEFGQQNVVLCQGVTYNEQGKWFEENEPDIEAAVRAAADVDVIIACIGENSYTETPGNLTDLTLSANQRNLVQALSKTGKPIVLVLNEGRPRIVSDIVPLATAVVDILLPGNYGGDALALLLAGKRNFSGRMPYTYPSEINSLANYDFKKSEEVQTMEGAYDYNARITQQWPFGYGLSYTSFEYSNLTCRTTHFTKDDTLTVTVDVTNTGHVAGKESILLYSSDLVASMTPDGRRLRAFEKVHLQPAETRTVTFQIAAADLAFVGYDGRWTLEEGEFVLSIGSLTTKICCDETYTWTTPNR